MFTILHKNFGGRVTNRYFKDWDTAKEELDKDVELTTKRGGEVFEKLNFFYHEKGFYVYEVSAFFKLQKEVCTWSLLDACFEDE